MGSSGADVPDLRVETKQRGGRSRLGRRRRPQQEEGSGSRLTGADSQAPDGSRRRAPDGSRRAEGSGRRRRAPTGGGLRQQAHKLTAAGFGSRLTAVEGSSSRRAEGSQAQQEAGGLTGSRRAAADGGGGILSRRAGSRRWVLRLRRWVLRLGARWESTRRLSEGPEGRRPGQRRGRRGSAWVLRLGTIGEAGEGRRGCCG